VARGKLQAAGCPVRRSRRRRRGGEVVVSSQLDLNVTFTKRNARHTLSTWFKIPDFNPEIRNVCLF